MHLKKSSRSQAYFYENRLAYRTLQRKQNHFYQLRLKKWLE